jgi:hypothetical protein
MSETAPRSNPRLENFEANKAAAEAAEAARQQDAFENEIYGDAGQGDNPANYTDEHLKRVEEADAYERHMEEMAKRPSYEPGSEEEMRARIQDMNDLNGAPSRGYNLEVEDAYAEDEAFNERIRAEGEALDRKVSSDPTLRFMDKISREIAELRATEVTEDTDEEAINARISKLEEVLQERLERYEASEAFDPAIADYMMDRDDTDARKKAAVKSLDELEREADSKGDVDPITGKLKTTAESDDDDVEVTGGKLKSTDDKDVDPITGKLKSAEDDEDIDPITGKLKSADDADEDVDPITGKLKSADDAEKTDDDEDVEPVAGELKRADDSELGDGPEEEKKNIFKRFGARLYRAFTYENEDGERKLSGKKLTIATLGLAAVAAAAYFTFRTGSDHSHLVPKGGPKGGDPIDAGSLPTPGPEAVVPGVDLPPSAGFDHPWNWAKEAFGADHAMSTLKDLAAKAAEHGHDVQWSGSGTHESVMIDGNDNTKFVIDTLKPFYTK